MPPKHLSTFRETCARKWTQLDSVFEGHCHTTTEVPMLQDAAKQPTLSQLEAESRAPMR